MPQPNTLDVCRVDLFTDKSDLENKYSLVLVERVLRIRDMYNYMINNPETKDRQFIEECTSRYKISKVMAYQDLAIIKSLLPMIGKASRDFHRWRYNEMIIETYQMAKARKDFKTMEKAATSYAKYNRIDLDEEKELPFDLIVVQPFTATSDPSVLGIKPIPDIKDRIQKLIAKYREETLDIEDVEYEEVDIEEDKFTKDDDEDVIL